MAVPPGNADALPLQGKSLMHLGGEEKKSEVKHNGANIARRGPPPWFRKGGSAQEGKLSFHPASKTPEYFHGLLDKSWSQTTYYLYSSLPHHLNSTSPDPLLGDIKCLIAFRG
eukprot:scaffold818_cov388-Pavlova_lutheri.AAC.17